MDVWQRHLEIFIIWTVFCASVEDTEKDYYLKENGSLCSKRSIFHLFRWNLKNFCLVCWKWNSFEGYFSFFGFKYHRKQILFYFRIHPCSPSVAFTDCFNTKSVLKDFLFSFSKSLFTLDDLKRVAKIVVLKFAVPNIILKLCTLNKIIQNDKFNLVQNLVIIKPLESFFYLHICPTFEHSLLPHSILSLG